MSSLYALHWACLSVLSISVITTQTFNFLLQPARNESTWCRLRKKIMWENLYALLYLKNVLIVIMWQNMQKINMIVLILQSGLYLFCSWHFIRNILKKNFNIQNMRTIFKVAVSITFGNSLEKNKKIKNQAMTCIIYALHAWLKKRGTTSNWFYLKNSWWLCPSFMIWTVMQLLSLEKQWSATYNP